MAAWWLAEWVYFGAQARCSGLTGVGVKRGWVVDHGGVELVVTLVEGVGPIALGLSY